MSAERIPCILTGEKIVEGIGSGRVFFVDREFALIPHLHLRGGQKAREKERRRFFSVVKVCEKELTAIMDRQDLPKEAVSILEVHRMMLADPVLRTMVGDRIIEKGINAEWAVIAVFEEMIARLQSNDADYYLKAKAADLEIIKDKILFSLLGGNGTSSYIRNLPEEDFILCAHALSIADISSLARNQHIRGIALEVPGGVSHLTIVLRSIGLPAVLGVDGLLKEAAGCLEVVVDGIAGEVVLNPTPSQKSFYAQKKRTYEEYYEVFLSEASKPAVSLDGVRMQIGANVEGEDEVEFAKQYGAEFIGLFRTELMFLEKGEVPTEEEHYAVYYEMLQRSHPMEVTIRVFDFGEDKNGGFCATSSMGIRGIRFCFLYPDIFIPQVRGLIRAAALGNLRILLPFVSAVDEVREFRRVITEQAKEMRLEKNLKHVKIGAMIELPAALFIAEMLGKEVDFFSVGTNDLVQYLMAVERKDKALSTYFSHFHPAVLRALYNLSHVARKNNVELSVCGEMGGDPYFTPLFLGMGILNLSMSPVAIPVVKKIVRTTSQSSGKALLNRLLMTTSESEMRDILEREMEEHYPHVFRKEWIDSATRGSREKQNK